MCQVDRFTLHPHGKPAAEGHVYGGQPEGHPDICIVPGFGQRLRHRARGHPAFQLGPADAGKAHGLDVVLQLRAAEDLAQKQQAGKLHRFVRQRQAAMRVACGAAAPDLSREGAQVGIVGQCVDHLRPRHRGKATFGGGKFCLQIDHQAFHSGHAF